METLEYESLHARYLEYQSQLESAYQEHLIQKQLEADVLFIISAKS